MFFKMCLSVGRAWGPKKLIEMKAYINVGDSAVCYGEGYIKIQYLFLKPTHIRICFVKR